MLGVDIFVIVLILLAIIFIVCFAKAVFKPIKKMRDAGSGERTKFVIDTSGKGYEYYKNIIENWLAKYNFSKYKSKFNARILKWKGPGITFKFGLNYYNKEKLIIIETFLLVLGAEYPLMEKTYSFEKGDINILDVAKLKNPISDGKEEIAIGKQGKDEYIKLLNSLFNMPIQLSEENKVSIKTTVDYKLKNM